jgi:hypothetical protein
MVAAAERLLVDALALPAGGPLRNVHEILDTAQRFELVGGLRRRVFFDPAFHAHVRAVIAALGFDVTRVAFDPARFRAVFHDAHRDAAARAAYFPHRDTWYGHPPAAIAAWIALSDLACDETFELFPTCFGRAVPNDSAEFDYHAWVGPDWARKIGWQRHDATPALYPSADSGCDTGPALRFSCRRGETLVFAAAHCHRTLPLAGGLSRFSLDFRFVHLDDVAQGRGAPDGDNRARGSCLDDYVHPSRPWCPPRA